MNAVFRAGPAVALDGGRRDWVDTEAWVVDLYPSPPAWSAVPTGDAVLVSAHGGSGASTVVGLHPDLTEAAGWPADGSLPVVVVCRSNAAGLVAAGRVLADHRDQPPLGVVVVADAPGRLPVPLARRVRLLEGLTVLRRVPWVEDWRRRGPSGPTPTEVARVLEQVAAAARPPAGT